MNNFYQYILQPYVNKTSSATILHSRKLAGIPMRNLANSSKRYQNSAQDAKSWFLSNFNQHIFYRTVSTIHPSQITKKNRRSLWTAKLSISKTSSWCRKIKALADQLCRGFGPPGVVLMEAPNVGSAARSPLGPAVALPKWCNCRAYKDREWKSGLLERYLRGSSWRRLLANLSMLRQLESREMNNSVIKKRNGSFLLCVLMIFSQSDWSRKQDGRKDVDREWTERRVLGRWYNAQRLLSSSLLKRDQANIS